MCYEVYLPTYSVGLVQLLGISSGYLAQKFKGGVLLEDLLSVEQLNYWNLWDYKGEHD